VGISHLHLQDLTPGAACHTESEQRIYETDEGYPVVWSEGISVVTLDCFCDQLNVIPNAIKIDTDGNEDKVLAGAEKLLQQQRLRAVILEMPLAEEKREKCRQFLRESGFQLRESSVSSTRNEIWVRCRD
jgi:hypothetical protein